MILTPAQRGHLAMFAFSALVAGSFSLGARAAPHIDPTALTLPRFALAGALVGAAAFLTTGVRRAHFVAPWRYGVLAALLAAYFVLMFEGLKTAPPVSAAAVFTLTPLLAAGFGWLVLRQITTPRMALALGLGAAGALWVIFRGDPAAALRMQIGRGEAVYFAGCAAHALYAPMVRRLNRGEPAVVFTFGMMLAGLGLLALYGWPQMLATDWLRCPHRVDLPCLCRRRRQCHDLRAAAICGAAPAFGQGHGLYLSGAQLGAAVGNRLWRRPARPRLLIGLALTALALVLLLKDETAARPAPSAPPPAAQ